MRVKKKSHTFFLLVIALALVLGAGCKGEKAKAPGSAVQKPAAKAVEPQPLKEEEKVEKQTYDYEARGRRDPFTSLIEVAKAKPVKKKGATPMENYDVSEIKLLAVVWDSRHYALIKLPDEKTYTIRKGMTLGLYGGKVEEITKDSILIREQIKDYRGQFKTKDTLLRLRKEGE
jgi:Tfp pilus assembly protein PilP